MFSKTKKLKIATVFSGIGAFEQALIKENVPFEILFACDNGEREIGMTTEEIKENIKKEALSGNEIDAYIKNLYTKVKKPNYVKQSYFANYEIEEGKWFEDIRFIDGKRYENRVDVFVGGSPCQSFSNMGKRGGLEDARGTLFYEYARLVQEIKPKVFIYENVPGMLNHDDGKTWRVVRGIFKKLGYIYKYKVLNAADYGIPQNRNRLFVVGFKEPTNFRFATKKKLRTAMSDYLEPSVDARFYLGEKGFKFVTTNSGRAKVNSSIIRTEKANQEFNWNGDFVFEPLSKVQNNYAILARAFVGEWHGQTGVCRQLTHRECLRLMGYPDTFKIVVPNVPAYRQAGNSIVVNVMQSIVSQIFKAKEKENA